MVTEKGSVTDAKSLIPDRGVDCLCLFFIASSGLRSLSFPAALVVVYFLVAMIKHSDNRNFSEKRLILA